MQAQETFEATPTQKELALEIVSNLTNATKQNLKNNNLSNQENIGNTADFYVFVSSSISDRALKHLIADTKKYDGIVVIRGLIQNDIRKTVAYLNRFIAEEGEGVIIDPNLFREYKIKTVPTFVLSKKEQNCGTAECEVQYDVLTGMVTPYFALSRFKQNGSLSAEAKKRLER